MTTAPVTIPAYRVFDTTVRRVTRLSPHFTRVTFTGTDLDLFGDTCLDQRVKVVLPRDVPPGQDPFATFPRTEDWWPRWRALPHTERNSFRTFTVRAVRHHAHEVDIDFALHGDLGPASRWATTVTPGAPCLLVGPDIRGDSAHVGVEWRPGNAATVLLAGDETAVPAIGAILERMPPHLQGQVFLEVADPDDILDLIHPPSITLTWLPREPGQQPGSRLINDVPPAIDAHPDTPAPPEDDPVNSADTPLWDTPDREPDGGRFAWIAGEAGAVKTIRRHLVGQHGWDRRNIAFMGYWRLGRSEV